MYMNSNKGFTLFELLVSVSIIGILTAIASVSFSNAQRKGRDARRMEDMKIIQNAAEMYYSVAGYVYPTTQAAWSFDGQAILQTFPADPKSGTDTPYTYVATSTTYCACANLEGNQGNSNANCNNFGAANDYYCVRNQQ